MLQFNPPNIERQKCVWKTKYGRLLEMCTVQQVEMKSVFIFQPIKRLVSTTVKSAKPAATFEYSFQKTKTDKYVVWW